MIELGGNITLVGFKEIGFSEMVVVKKIVGNYARKISDKVGAIDNLTMTVKPIHKSPNEENSKYELHVRLTVKGKVYSTELTDFNLFVAIDSAMKKIESELRLD
jgi:ribosome-associated translation inhibitor RaiA